MITTGNYRASLRSILNLAEDDGTPPEIACEKIAAIADELLKMSDEAGNAGLCQDEGCPHAGTPHICINSAPTPELVTHLNVETSVEQVFAAHFADYEAESFATDDDGHLLEAAMQANAVLLNDDGTIYAYKQEDLLRLIKCALAQDFRPLWSKGNPDNRESVKPRPPLTFTYRNYRGEVRQRRITSPTLWYGTTEWHPEPQWFINAIDVDSGMERDFAFADIIPHIPGAKLQVGQRVLKHTGEAHWIGDVVSVYRTSKGAGRHVVEVIPQGFQMIAVESQLRPWDKSDDAVVDQLGWWLSAALEDEKAAPEFKAAINAWFEVFGDRS